MPRAFAILEAYTKGQAERKRKRLWSEHSTVTPPAKCWTPWTPTPTRASPRARGPGGWPGTGEQAGKGQATGALPPGAGPAPGPHDPGAAGGGGSPFFAGGGQDWLDTAIILLIVVFNTVISVSQEDNARKALEALEKLAAPGPGSSGRGVERRLESTHLVPGDILLLEAGTMSPPTGGSCGPRGCRPTSRP